MSSQFNCTGNCSNSTEEDCDTDIHLHVGLRVLQAIVLVAITLACFGINSVVLIVNVTRKNLHTRNFLLPLQIICSNLLYSVSVLSFSVVTAGAGDWILGHGMCQFVALASSVAITNQLLFSLVIPLDKTFSVFFPFWYQRNGFRVSLMMCVTAWVIVVIRVILPLDSIRDSYGYKPRFNTCGFIADYTVSTFLVQALLFFLAVCVPFVLNAALFLKARKMSVQILPSTGTSEEDHQALVSRRKRERRAINTVLILFSVLLFLKMPMMLLLILLSSVEQRPVVVYITQFLFNPFFHTVFISDALIILRNKEFRAETKKLFKDVKEKVHMHIQKLSSS